MPRKAKLTVSDLLKSHDRKLAAIAAHDRLLEEYEQQYGGAPVAKRKYTKRQPKPAKAGKSFKPTVITRVMRMTPKEERKIASSRAAPSHPSGPSSRKTPRKLVAKGGLAPSSDS